jgi:hypothetical protein
MQSDLKGMFENPIHSNTLHDWLFVDCRDDGVPCFVEFRNQANQSFIKQQEVTQKLRDIESEIENRNIVIQCVEGEERYYHRQHLQRLFKQRQAARLDAKKRLEQLGPLITRDMNKMIMDCVHRHLAVCTQLNCDSDGKAMINGSVVYASWPQNEEGSIGLYKWGENGCGFFVCRDGSDSIPVDDTFRLHHLSEKSEHQHIPLFDRPEWVQRNLHQIPSQLRHIASIVQEQLHAVDQDIQVQVTDGENMELGRREEFQTKSDALAVSNNSSRSPQPQRRRGAVSARRRLAGSNPFSLEKRVREGRFV